jgi:hypothetical protein
MELIITLPDEFINDYSKDGFRDSLMRILGDAKRAGTVLTGNMDRELIDVLLPGLVDAIAKSRATANGKEIQVLNIPGGIKDLDDYEKRRSAKEAVDREIMRELTDPLVISQQRGPEPFVMVRGGNNYKMSAPRPARACEGHDWRHEFPGPYTFDETVADLVWDRDCNTVLDAVTTGFDDVPEAVMKSLVKAMNGETEVERAHLGEPKLVTSDSECYLEFCVDGVVKHLDVRGWGRLTGPSNFEPAVAAQLQEDFGRYVLICLNQINLDETETKKED